MSQTRVQRVGQGSVSLQALAAAECGARGNLKVPRVVAYHESRHLLLLTYERGEPVSNPDKIVKATLAA